MTYLVPPIIIFLPLARIVGALGRFDSWWTLVVVYPTFTIVVLPLTRPGIVIAAIFAFTLAMQESLYAVVYVAPRYSAFLDHFIRGLTASGTS